MAENNETENKFKYTNSCRVDCATSRHVDETTGKPLEREELLAKAIEAIAETVSWDYYYGPAERGETESPGTPSVLVIATDQKLVTKEEVRDFLRGFIEHGRY